MPTRLAARAFPLPRLVAALTAALLLAACDSPSGPRPAGDPAQATIVSGDLQTGTVGAEVAPLVVRITDADGKPVAGQSVQFQVISGGGTVTPPTATTDAGGAASATWTLGTVARDTQRVEVRVLSASGAVLATGVFRAVARPDAPAKLVTVAGQGQTGPAGAMLADSLAVRLTDRFDNPVSGQPVAWSVLSGGGRVNPPAATTDSSGVARTAWTLGLRVDSAQTAAATFGTLPPDTFRATATVQGTLTKLKGDAQTGAPGAPLRDSLVVVLTAPSGQPVQGATIVWTTTSGSVVPATTRTDAAGRAATWWLLGDAGGPATATASVVGGPSATFSATASQALTVQVVSGDGQTAYGGASLRAPLQVRVTDALGRPRAGVPVTWSATAGSGTVVPDSPTTGDDGTATARWTLGRDAGTDTVFATIGSGAPAEFNATSLGVTRLEKVLGDMHADSVGGAPYVLAVRLLDAANRPIAGAIITWYATEANFSPPQSVTAADGSASTTLTDFRNRAGTQTVSAEARMDDPARPPLTPNTSTEFIKTTLPGAPTALRIEPSSGSGLPLNTTLLLTVELRDRYGSRVPRAGVPVTLTAAGSSAQPDPQQPVTDSTGVAHARWTLTTAGTATLTASSPGLTPVTTSYNVASGPSSSGLFLQDSVANGFVYVYTAVLMRTQDSVVARTRGYSTRFDFQFTSGQGTDGPYYGRWAARVPLNAIYDDETWIFVDAYSGGSFVVHDSIQFRAPPTPPTPLAPAALRIAQPPSGTGLPVGTDVRLAVELLDGNGSRVMKAGVPVNLQASGSDWQPDPLQPVTDSTGVAYAHWKVSRAGTASVSATSPGLPSYFASYPVGGSNPFPPLSLQDSISNGFIYVYTGVLQRTPDSLFARTRAYSTRFEFQPTSGQGTDGASSGRWVARIPLNAVYDDESYVIVDAHYVSGVYVVHDSVLFRAPPNSTGQRLIGVQVVSGNGQSAYGRAFLRNRLRVRVTDAAGAPVAGLPVEWLAADGSGTILPDSPVSGADGTATATWSLGDHAQTDTVIVSVGTGWYATFTAQSLGLVRLDKVAGDMHADTAGSAPYVLTVRLIDNSSQPIAGAVVTWSANQASFEPPQSVTAADGTASTTLTDYRTQAGADYVRARAEITDPSLPPLTPDTYVDFTRIILAEAPTALQVQPASGGYSLNAIATIRVQLLDRFGNPAQKAGVPITLTTSGSGGQPTPQQPVTDAGGAAFASWTLTTTGTATITASSPGLTSSTASYNVGGGRTDRGPLFLQDSVANGYVYVYTVVLMRTQDSLVARTRGYSTRFNFQFTSGQGTDGPYYGRWAANIPLNAIYNDETWVYVDVYSGGTVDHDSIQFRSPQAMSARPSAGTPSLVALQPGDNDALPAAHGWPRTSTPDSPAAEAVYAVAPVAAGSLRGGAPAASTSAGASRVPAPVPTSKLDHPVEQ